MEWSKAVTELEATGRTLTEIAAEVGLSVAALSDIKQGRSKCPRGMSAVKLHAMAVKFCPHAFGAATAQAGKRGKANSPQAKAA